MAHTIDKDNLQSPQKFLKSRVAEVDFLPQKSGGKNSFEDFKSRGEKKRHKEGGRDGEAFPRA